MDTGLGAVRFVGGEVVLEAVVGIVGCRVQNDHGDLDQAAPDIDLTMPSAHQLLSGIQSESLQKVVSIALPSCPCLLRSSYWSLSRCMTVMP